MRRPATVRNAMGYLVLALGSVCAQTTEWRRVGSLVVEGPYPGPASGPVERVWYGPDGATLYLRTGSGRVFETSDFEKWTSSRAVAPPALEPGWTIHLPEPGARGRVGSRVRRPEVYAFGRQVHKSLDEGLTWENVTQFRGVSILGAGLADLAVSPSGPEEIVAAARSGVWRSLDGGLTWSGLNDTLPNLPARKLVAVPGPGELARLELPEGEVVWQRGKGEGWAPSVSKPESSEWKQRVSQALQVEPSAVAVSGETLYAGSTDGRLWASADTGRTWQAYTVPNSGTVESIWIGSSRVAVAALAAGPEGGARIVRTANGGLFWDDLSGNLPAATAHGVSADLAAGAIYAATEAGLFLAYADLGNASPATAWSRIEAGLPPVPALDVRLDAAGNQLYVLLDGYGVYATLAPHRFRDPRIVSAADGSLRPAAPGALLSVLGREASAARAGSLDVPILGASGGESQLQVPFEASGGTLALGLQTPAGPQVFNLDLRPTSPAIFVDRDGIPMILDADRGLLLDSATPARAGSRIQILATGLGRVTPDWPTGLAAPAANTPRVVAPVRVYLDRQPVEVLKAALAPRYAGFYIVEVQLPDVVNSGPAELYLEAGGESSGRVSLALAQ